MKTPEARLQLAALVFVIDYFETEFCGDEPSDFESLYKYFHQQTGVPIESIEGPFVNGAVAITIRVEPGDDIQELMRRVDAIVPWKDGPREVVRHDDRDPEISFNQR